MQNNEYKIHKNSKRVDHEHMIIYRFMLNNIDDIKYETLYKESFGKTKCWNNVTVTLQYGERKIDKIYVAVSHIHLIQKLRILFPIMMSDDVNM